LINLVGSIASLTDFSQIPWRHDILINNQALTPILLTGFIKKSKAVPASKIRKAKALKNDYLKRAKGDKNG